MSKHLKRNKKAWSWSRDKETRDINGGRGRKGGREGEEGRKGQGRVHNDLRGSLWIANLHIMPYSERQLLGIHT